jgi:hypothetical protein
MDIENNFLFRGVNEEMFAKNKKKLIPKGHKFTYTPQFGTIRFGEGYQFGETTTNAILVHQIDSSLTSGISTTLSFEKAKYYALYNNYKKGYIYKINRSKLKKFDIAEYTPDTLGLVSPNNRKDLEVILVSKSNNLFPDEIIDEIIEVE